MRHLPLVSTLLVIAAACAPAAAPAPVLTEALIEHAPRYRLVYDPRGSEGMDPAVLVSVQVAIEEELAHRGLLTAAPWETPTLMVRYALGGHAGSTEGIEQSGPRAYAFPVNGRCQGSDYDAGHCTILDQLTLSGSAAGTSSGDRVIALQVLDLNTGTVRDTASGRSTGNWSRARNSWNKELVTSVVGRLDLAEAR